MKQLDELKSRLCCLVPKPGVQMPSCHEKTLCDCEVLRIVAACEAMEERLQTIHFMRDHLEDIEIPNTAYAGLVDAEAILRGDTETLAAGRLGENNNE